MADDDGIAISHVKSRAERDAEGFANAIVLSSDDDDNDVPRAPPLVLPRSSVPGGSSSSSAAGKRPMSEQATVDVKPDIKRLRPETTPVPPPAALNRNIQPTILQADLSFADPLKGAKSAVQARRAGHVMLKLSTAAVPGDASDAIIGTGFEHDAHSRLQALTWQVRVDDETHGQQLLGAIRRLANPMNTRGPRARHGYPLVEVEWQPKLPWRLTRGQPPVAVRLDIWLRPEIFDLRISTWQSAQSCFYDIWLCAI